MFMIGYDLDRGSLKDSKNAPNLFFTIRNWKGSWPFGTDVICSCKLRCLKQRQVISGFNMVLKHYSSCVSTVLLPEWLSHLNLPPYVSEFHHLLLPSSSKFNTHYFSHWIKLLFSKHHICIWKFWYIAPQYFVSV